MADTKKHFPNSGIAFRAEGEKKDKWPDLENEGDGSIECPHCKKTVSFYISQYLKNGAKGIFSTFRFKPKNQQPQPGQSAPGLGDFPSQAKGQQASLSLPTNPPQQRQVMDDEIPF
jgi:hypothetical protein